MANLLSKIKLPNNTEYLLKDETLTASTGISIADIDTNNQRTITNTGVTSIKGNSESSYRTGQVNLTAANIGAKATQSAVNDVSADGTSLTFISQVTQNAQGVITPLKKTVSTMGAASADAAGSAGLVPAPAKGNQSKYLRGDGTWQTVITAHRTYTSFTGKPTANATPDFGESFTVSQISQSTTGQVSGTDYTITIPSLPTASSDTAGITTVGASGGAAAYSHNHDSSYVAKSIGTAAGDIIYWSEANTPVRLAKGSDGEVLKLDSGVPTWATDNNNYVRQSSSSTANWRKLLLHYQNDAASTTAVTNSTNVVYAAVGISAQPSTGTIRANAYNVKDNVTLQYNSADNSLDFVFA